MLPFLSLAIVHGISPVDLGGSARRIWHKKIGSCAPKKFLPAQNITPLARVRRLERAIRQAKTDDLPTMIRKQLRKDGRLADRQQTNFVSRAKYQSTCASSATGASHFPPKSWCSHRNLIFPAQIPRLGAKNSFFPPCHKPSRHSQLPSTSTTEAFPPWFPSRYYHHLHHCHHHQSTTMSDKDIISHNSAGAPK